MVVYTGGGPIKRATDMIRATWESLGWTMEHNGVGGRKWYRTRNNLADVLRRHPDAWVEVHTRRNAFLGDAIRGRSAPIGRYYDNIQAIAVWPPICPALGHVTVYLYDRGPRDGQLASDYDLSLIHI